MARRRLASCSGSLPGPPPPLPVDGLGQSRRPGRPSAVDWVDWVAWAELAASGSAMTKRLARLRSTLPRVALVLGAGEYSPHLRRPPWRPFRAACSDARGRAFECTSFVTRARGLLQLGLRPHHSCAPAARVSTGGPDYSLCSGTAGSLASTPGGEAALREVMARLPASPWTARPSRAASRLCRAPRGLDTSSSADRRRGGGASASGRASTRARRAAGARAPTYGYAPRSRSTATPRCARPSTAHARGPHPLRHDRPEARRSRRDSPRSGRADPGGAGAWCQPSPWYLRGRRSRELCDRYGTLLCSTSATGWPPALVRFARRGGPDSVLPGKALSGRACPVGAMVTRVRSPRALRSPPAGCARHHLRGGPRAMAAVLATRSPRRRSASRTLPTGRS
jgi:hypothetical protein